jgi:O-antigen/teichoic acid export membrane protein
LSGSSYGRGARLLSVGIASTGVVTFAYFSVASYVLDDVAYKRISLLWSVLFVTVTVIYRPVEQLLSRNLAAGRDVTRSALRIQAVFAAAALGIAIALRDRITDGVFGGEDALWGVFVAAVAFYAASYFARGWLAGHRRFEVYGALVFLEATSRLLFAVAVAVGLATGQVAVALGMAAAPLVSLIVVPLAFRRGGHAIASPGGTEVHEAGRFAVAVLAIMLAEQTLINAAVLTADATATDAAVAGFVFNALLIARAPLQLFQAIQGSLLPHLAGLEDDAAEFARAIRVTVLAIAAFAGAVAVGLLALGPWAMDLLFDDPFHYPRGGLVLVAIGMGAHLAAGTLNQAALARDRATAAAACWLVVAAGFVAWMLSDAVGDELLRAEIGYASASGALCALLAGVYHRSSG